MLDLVRGALGALLLAVTTLTPAGGGAENRGWPDPDRKACRPPLDGGRRQAGAQKFARTELYFGTAMPDGVVTGRSFKRSSTNR